MKIRNGFVSNSSSSSFICDVCGETAEGYDLCLSEAEMVECDYGHIFCEDHQLEGVTEEQLKAWVIEHATEKIERLKGYSYGSYKDAIEQLKSDIENIDEVWEEYLQDLKDDEYVVPNLYCPLCQMKSVNEGEMNQYLYRKHGLDPEKVKEEIRSSFKNYESFKEYIRGEDNENS